MNNLPKKTPALIITNLTPKKPKQHQIIRIGSKLHLSTSYRKVDISTLDPILNGEHRTITPSTTQNPNELNAHGHEFALPKISEYDRHFRIPCGIHEIKGKSHE